MKKLILCIFGFAITGAAGANNYYQLKDECRSEISTYCSSTAVDVTDCLVEKNEYLSNDCSDAVKWYDRQRFGWDKEVYEKWYSMNDKERHEYRTKNRDKMLKYRALHIDNANQKLVKQ